MAETFVNTFLCHQKSPLFIKTKSLVSTFYRTLFLGYIKKPSGFETYGLNLRKWWFTLYWMF